MTDFQPTMIPVLRDGFVCLVDHMGDDAAIVQAARVSYGPGTKTPSDDRKLIRYLMRHRHTSPFEMCEVKLHVKVPIFVARQWVRHRTASMNEVSGRYSELDQGEYRPFATDWRAQAKTNKQGSEEGQLKARQILFWTDRTNEGLDFGRSNYDGLLHCDVAREQARMVLPLSTWTEFYWKIDLHNLFHFLKLRLDRHAQEEIRVYAEAILKIIEPLFPIAVEAWRDYVLEAVTFSREEMENLRRLVAPLEASKPTFWYKMDGSAAVATPREDQEFREKLWPDHSPVQA